MSASALLGVMAFSHMIESEHPPKSIAVKGLPSSRFFEQQDARMFSSRRLQGAPSTFHLLLL